MRKYRFKTQITQRSLKNYPKQGQRPLITEITKNLPALSADRQAADRDFKTQITQIVLLVSGFWLLVSMATGCGYTTRPYIHSDFRKISIQPFANKIDLTKETSEHRRLITYYPLLERKITSQVIEQFILDGNLRVVKEEEADCILEGELIEFRRDVLRYTERNEPKEYRLTLVVNLFLWEKGKEKAIWQEKNFFGDTTYFVTGALAKSESEAIDDAIKDLARRVVDRTVEVW